MTAAAVSEPADQGDKAQSTSTIASAAAHEFWRKYLDNLMGPLFHCTKSYRPTDVEKHMRFIRHHIPPCLGVRPDEAHAAYTPPASLVGSPVDASLNLYGQDGVKARFDLDFIGPASRSGPDPFGEQDVMRQWQHLAAVTGADTAWMLSLANSLFLTQQETAVAVSRIPAHLNIPPGMVAFDFEGGKMTMKAYVPAMRKAIVQGRSSTQVVLDALAKLEPMGAELAPARTVLADYLSSCEPDNDLTLMMCAVDCVDVRLYKNARVKCYLHTSSTSFATVRDVMTLGGRLSDDTSTKRVDLLRSIWPILTCDTDGATLADENFVKPERLPKTGYSGLQFTVDLTPGSPIPETKIYFPLFQYAKDYKAAEKNVESSLQKLGHAWGQGGKYSSAMSSVFGQGKLYGQMYLSFSYTETKGIYITSYVSAPIDGSACLEPTDLEYV